MSDLFLTSPSSSEGGSSAGGNAWLDKEVVAREKNKEEPSSSGSDPCGFGLRSALTGCVLKMREKKRRPSFSAEALLFTHAGLPFVSAGVYSEFETCLRPGIPPRLSDSESLQGFRACGQVIK